MRLVRLEVSLFVVAQCCSVGRFLLQMGRLTFATNARNEVTYGAAIDACRRGQEWQRSLELSAGPRCEKTGLSEINCYRFADSAEAVEAERCS